MKLKFLRPTAFVTSSAAVFGGLTTTVAAQGFLPDPIQNVFNLLGPGGTGTAQFVQSRVSALLLIFLGVIILAAVVYTAMAALRYIQSRGDEGEVGEARKGIEAIFQGIAVMLIAIVGIVLIFVFFGAQLFSPALYQVCVSAPNSAGCNACNDPAGGLPDGWDDLKFDPAVAVGSNSGTAQEKCGYCEWNYFQASRTNETIEARFTSGANQDPVGLILCTE